MRRKPISKAVDKAEEPQPKAEEISVKDLALAENESDAPKPRVRSAARKSTAAKSTEQLDETQRRIARLREIVDSPRSVGAPEEKIPFAWRHSLTVSALKRPSRILRAMAQQEDERTQSRMHSPDLVPDEPKES